MPEFCLETGVGNLACNSISEPFRFTKLQVLVQPKSLYRSFPKTKPPGDSIRPFDSLLGGHLTFPNKQNCQAGIV